MPEAVKEYARSQSIIDVHKAHTDLIQSYLDDINKYSGSMQIDNVDLVLVAIAQQVGKQVKYSSIAPDWRTEKTKKVLALLEKMMFIQRALSTSAQGIPLGASVSEKVFKCLFLDVGLMHTMCGVQPSETLQADDLLDVFRGALAEQFAGQQILAQGGCENRKMYYWSRQEKSSTAEVDYVVARSGEIFPVEIKSGPTGRLRSLAIFLAEHRQCRRGLVLSSRNVYHDQSASVSYYPLYSSLAA
jgi:predicted AAA+ superfamily ATPase